MVEHTIEPRAYAVGNVKFEKTAPCHKLQAVSGTEIVERLTRLELGQQVLPPLDGT